MEFNLESTNIQQLVVLYKTFAAMQAFKGVNKFQEALAKGEKDMFEVYLESVPFNLNTLAMAFGEVYYFETYIKRISLLKCEKTKLVFE